MDYNVSYRLPPDYLKHSFCIPASSVNAAYDKAYFIISTRFPALKVEIVSIVLKNNN